MNDKTRQYVAELGGATIGYVALVLASTVVARSVELADVTRYAVLLSPMIPARRQCPPWFGCVRQQHQ
jgi:hypothetical protein